MSRLIDADALIEVIKESRPLNWTDSESELQEDADYNHFIEMVNAQPTAYDIEKVVEQLEKRKALYDSLWADCRNELVAEYNLGWHDAILGAIEIVRKGGVNG